MLSTLLRSRYCFTNDDRLLVEVENTAASCRDIGAEGSTPPDTFIFSIRCSHPFSFYYRGIDGFLSAKETAEDSISLSPSVAEDRPSQHRPTPDPDRSYRERPPSSSLEASLSFSSSTRSSLSLLSPKAPAATTPGKWSPSPRLSHASPRNAGGAEELEDLQTDSKVSTMMDCGMIPVEHIQNASDRLWQEMDAATAFPFLPSRVFRSAKENQFAPSAVHRRRPLFVSERLPDGVLGPGESRSFLFDIDDPELFKKQLKYASSLSSNHSVCGGDSALNTVVFYIYYQRLGPTEKCVRLAAEWLQRESELYKKWQESYMKRVVALEKKNTALLRKDCSSATNRRNSSCSATLPSNATLSHPDSYTSRRRGGVGIPIIPAEENGEEKKISTVVPLMDTRMGDLQKSFHAIAFSSSASLNNPPGSPPSWKSHESSARARRIIPPVLGSAVRWGVLNRPKAVPLHQLVPQEAFQNFYHAVTARSANKDFHTVLRHELAPVLYEDTHTKPVSGSAAKLFAGSPFPNASLSSVLRILASSVGCGQDSQSSSGLRTPLLPSPSLLLQPFKGSQSRTPPQEPLPFSASSRIGAGSGLALLQPDEDRSDSKSLDASRRSLSLPQGGWHQHTETLDPMAAERYASANRSSQLEFSAGSVGDSQKPRPETEPPTTWSSRGEGRTPLLRAAAAAPPKDPIMPLAATRGVLSGPLSRGSERCASPPTSPPEEGPTPSSSAPHPEPRIVHRDGSPLSPVLHRLLSDWRDAAPHPLEWWQRALRSGPEMEVLWQQLPRAQEIVCDTVVPAVVHAGQAVGSSVAGVLGSPLTLEVLRRGGLPVLLLLMVYFLNMMLFSSFGGVDVELEELLA